MCVGGWVGDWVGCVCVCRNGSNMNGSQLKNQFVIISLSLSSCFFIWLFSISLYWSLFYTIKPQSCPTHLGSILSTKKWCAQLCVAGKSVRCRVFARVLIDFHTVNMHNLCMLKKMSSYSSWRFTLSWSLLVQNQYITDTNTTRITRSGVGPLKLGPLHLFKWLRVCLIC